MASQILMIPYIYRVEALYTHGENDAARSLAVKLAEEMLNKPEQFVKENKYEKVFHLET